MQSDSVSHLKEKIINEKFNIENDSKVSRSPVIFIFSTFKKHFQIIYKMKEPVHSK